jgi:protein associated with RNAse G/E
MITVNSRKFDGSIRRSWNCELLEQRGSLLIFVGEFEFAVDHPDLGYIEKGTVSYEYYWLDRWYNAFRFHTVEGALRYYYFNINMPPTFADGVLDYVDLDIDVLVQPDLTYTVLDLDDFNRNARTLGYPDEVRTRTRAALDEVLRSIEQKTVDGAPELFAT